MILTMTPVHQRMMKRTLQLPSQVLPMSPRGRRGLLSLSNLSNDHFDNVETLQHQLGHKNSNTAIATAAAARLIKLYTPARAI